MLEKELSDIQNKIGYHFKNPVLLSQAFISPSITAATQQRVQNYQILEFIGDSVLSLAVVKNLLEEKCAIDKSGQLISTEREGRFSEEKADLVKNETLARCSLALGFDQYVEHAAGNLFHDRKNKKGDLVEAVLGAVALDSNWNISDCALVAKNILAFATKPADFVQVLSDFCKSRSMPEPRYSLWQSERGFFDYSVSVLPIYPSFIGSGSSEEDAKNDAAENAYRFFVGAGNKKSVQKKSPAIIDFEKSDWQKNHSPDKNPVVYFQNKVQIKEILEPAFSFAREAEGKKAFWSCRLSFYKGGKTKTFVGKALKKKEARQTACGKALDFLEGNSQKKLGSGLLHRAIQLLGTPQTT